MSFSWLWSLFTGSSSSSSGPSDPAKTSATTTTISIPKYETNPTDPMALQLCTALQYGTAVGLPALGQFLYDFTSKVYDPAYSNFQILLNAGSTDAWSKIVPTLCERGDGILCEEWTYPSALATAWPHGVTPVACPMDGEGMTPEGMENLLATWNPLEHNGMRRPQVLYTVPVCQNPTGATMTVERKKAIYEVAVKYDVIIVEDDPYYFLQAGEYKPASVRGRKDLDGQETDEEFLASLVPSYLRFDYQGRVIRIDTFSKTIAPGSRLGWTTAQPILIERLQRANESSTQSASGFAQVLVAKLLVEEWGFKGYLQWLKGLKAQYRRRRDSLVDSLLNQADAALDARTSTNTMTTASPFSFLSPNSNNGSRPKTIYTLVIPAPKRMRDEKGFLIEKQRETKEQSILSFVAPEGGMFVWLRIHTSQHPAYPRKSTEDLINTLWIDLAEANVLVAPGTMFSGTHFGERPPSSPSANSATNFNFNTDRSWEGSTTSPAEGEKLLQIDGDGFFRIAFSTATDAEMKKAMSIVGTIVKTFWSKKLL